MEKLLSVVQGEQAGEDAQEGVITAPSRVAEECIAQGRVLQPVEIMATLPGRGRDLVEKVEALGLDEEIGDIVAVRQGNVFGTSFHPELTEDARIHVWWLKQVKEQVLSVQNEADSPNVR